MWKIDIHTKITSNTFVIPELFPVICSDRVGSDRQWFQELNHSICHGFSRLMLNFSQEGQPRLPLSQGDNRILMSSSYDHIHFPITQALAGIRNGRPLVDHFIDDLCLTCTQSLFEHKKIERKSLIA
jgi:hypothetical protein